jgi:hypothetical protein
MNKRWRVRQFEMRSLERQSVVTRNKRTDFIERFGRIVSSTRRTACSRPNGWIERWLRIHRATVMTDARAHQVERHIAPSYDPCDRQSL